MLNRWRAFREALKEFHEFAYWYVNRDSIEIQKGLDRISTKLSTARAELAQRERDTDA